MWNKNVHHSFFKLFPCMVIVCSSRMQILYIISMVTEALTGAFYMRWFFYIWVFFFFFPIERWESLKLNLSDLTDKQLRYVSRNQWVFFAVIEQEWKFAMASCWSSLCNLWLIPEEFLSQEWKKLYLLIYSSNIKFCMKVVTLVVCWC